MAVENYFTKKIEKTSEEEVANTKEFMYKAAYGNRIKEDPTFDRKG